ncbi:hypothetical protein GCM10010460_06720 [Microbacterium terrae]|uniref:Serine/arginine repetitive matrix protein 2 n=2 Tax=Microbacterium terrae TaxID=69369 RepID=A0A0M2GV99_9MICO|nr:hypothetical protein RS81_03333 [Microbacterium terrae]GLJ97233.1 hypothetical protein GCM10017594_04300 [Microbacterium terrae]
MTMTTATSTLDFRASEGLRALLERMHRADGRAWSSDPEAADLMRYAATRFAALARKHGLDPWEAAAAAFDAMRAPWVRRAEDPWAVVTRAVQVTCIAEERARGLLCSVHQARRTRYAGFHDVERFSDRENPLTEYHAALSTSSDSDPRSAELPNVTAAVDDAVAVFELLGWPADHARSSVDYVCTRLGDAASRPAAYDLLRRDKAARVVLDLPGYAWRTMLTVLLGVPNPAQRQTAAGRGILVRLLIGETIDSLLDDDRLVTRIQKNLPAVQQ